jgi:A/G-specific adenine glycosylase
VAARRPAGSGERFEQTQRWVRGRIVAALAAGEGVPQDIERARVEVALAGLVRDGLVVADERGTRLAS